MWKAPYYARRYDIPATLVMLAIMAGVFLLCLVTADAPVPWLAWMPSVLWLKSGAYWQPLTFPFVHSSHDFLQLLFDGIALYFLGGSLERSWGGAKYVFFIFSSGIVAGLVLIPQSAVTGIVPIFIGLTGGFVAIPVAFAAMNPFATINFNFFPMQARWMAFIIVGFELFANYGRYGGLLQAFMSIAVVSLYAYLFATRRVALPSIGASRGPSLKERFERWQQRRRMRNWQRRVSKIDRPEDLFKDK
jgi:membrane associated rhomboid family serine protease